MSEPTLPPGLLDYLAISDQRRADDVTATLAAMTEMGRRLFREAAVMGYVCGAPSMPGGHNVEIPGDRWIVEHVVTCIRGNLSNDLYPITNNLTRRCETCGKRALDCGHPWPRDKGDDDGD